MNKASAEQAILKKLRACFAKEPPSSADGGFLAYSRLAREHPDLIDALRYRGDPWQAVQGLINRNHLLVRS